MVMFAGRQSDGYAEPGSFYSADRAVWDTGPGGATLIQDVGAYGQEVAETLVAVRSYDRERGEVADLSAAQCGFGYQTSAFKRALYSWAAAGPAVTGRFVVLGDLPAGALAPVRAGALRRTGPCSASPTAAGARGCLSPTR
jgi:hypothetical protein